MIATGILFAFTALFGWGVGDFFIQRTTRAIGSWATLFFISAISIIAIFPFITHELGRLEDLRDITLVLVVGIITLATAIVDFEAMKIGKISVVEPIFGAEIPVTLALSVGLLSEKISPSQFLLIFATFASIVLTITIHHSHLHYHKRIFEKGALLAGIGAGFLALMNFTVGIASRKTSPLFTIWFTHLFLLSVCLVYFIIRGKLPGLVQDIKRKHKIILAQGVFDNVGWISYAYAATLIPISIATTISEGYIALGVILGIFINREKLKSHQITGAVLTIISVLTLAAITK